MPLCEHYLGHEEGLADFRGTGKEISPAVKQSFNDRASGREGHVIEFRHGDRVEARLSDNRLLFRRGILILVHFGCSLPFL